MKKNFTIFLFSFLFFLSLVFYNYLIAQKKIHDTKAAPLGIELVSYPQEIAAGGTGTFIWHVNASPDQNTSQTTIFYGYSASPSALLAVDSPEAVSYPHFQDGYTEGVFSLPDTFDLGIKFEKPGTVFFRAYAKVGENHLWTDEKTLLIR